MKREVTALSRRIGEAEELLEVKGKLRPVYRLIEPDGSGSGLVDITGEPVEQTEGDVIFKVLVAPFRLLTRGARHTLLPHGRGAGISTTLGVYTLGLALLEPARILVVREVLASAKKSAQKLLTDLIERDHRLDSFFSRYDESIVGKNGSEFIFAGVRTHSADAIKSTEGLRYVWGEESQNLSSASIRTINYTVRSPSARLYWVFNPTKPKDPIVEEFGDRDDVVKPDVPYTLADNPLLDDGLRAEAEVIRRRDPEQYSHEFGGNIRTYSEGRVFNNFLVAPEPIDIEAVIARRLQAIHVGYKGTVQSRRERWQKKADAIRNGYCVGVDVGYADPTVFLLTHVDFDAEIIYVLREYYRRGLDPNQIVAAMGGFPLPSKGWPFYVDSS